MFGFILSCIILFAIGSCAIKNECRPDKEGNTYKWCNTLFEKDKAKK